MSKYKPLWEFVGKSESSFVMTFGEIEALLGFPLDHSFLNCKKELSEYGFLVGKISMKNETVEFIKA
jgi:hypothetical protein